MKSEQTTTEYAQWDRSRSYDLIKQQMILASFILK